MTNISQKSRNLWNLWRSATDSRFLAINEGSTGQTWDALAYPKYSGTDGSGTGDACSLADRDRRSTSDNLSDRRLTKPERHSTSRNRDHMRFYRVLKSLSSQDNAARSP